MGVARAYSHSEVSPTGAAQDPCSELCQDTEVVFPLGESTALHIQVLWDILSEPQCCITATPPRAYEGGQQCRQCHTFTSVSLTSLNLIFIPLVSPYFATPLCLILYVTKWPKQANEMISCAQPSGETNSSVSARNDRTPVIVDHWGFCCFLACPGTLENSHFVHLCPLVSEYSLSHLLAERCIHKACSPLIPLQDQVGNTTIIGFNLHQSLIVKIILVG